MCHCVGSGAGSAVGAAAVSCTYEGECQSQSQVCAAQGQACFDPDTTNADDWQCLCVFPLKGEAFTKGVATCLLDECEPGTTGRTICGDVGQECKDPLPFSNSTNDWACICVSPAVGQASLKAAECVWQGECAENHKTCTNRGQTCSDSNANIVGDWQCQCVSPSVGKSAIAQVATCEVNECETHNVCTKAGQTCIDPNFSEKGDWICRCAGDGTGDAEGQPATCGYISKGCTAFSATCTSNGQACVSPQNNEQFSCQCLSPLSGTKEGAPAVCSEQPINECTSKGQVCTDAGQSCNDPNERELHDWRCQCEGSSTSALGRAADCATAPPGQTPAPTIQTTLFVCPHPNTLLRQLVLIRAALTGTCRSAFARGESPSVWYFG